SDLALGEAGALGADRAGLRERADGRRGQRRETEHGILLRAPRRVVAAAERALVERRGAGAHGAVADTCCVVTVLESGGCGIQLGLDGGTSAAQAAGEHLDLAHLLV